MAASQHQLHETQCFGLLITTGSAGHRSACVLPRPRSPPCHTRLCLIHSIHTAFVDWGSHDRSFTSSVWAHLYSKKCHGNITLPPNTPQVVVQHTKVVGPRYQGERDTLLLSHLRYCCLVTILLAAQHDRVQFEPVACHVADMHISSVHRCIIRCWNKRLQCPLPERPTVSSHSRSACGAYFPQSAIILPTMTPGLHRCVYDCSLVPVSVTVSVRVCFVCLYCMQCVCVCVCVCVC